MRAMVMAAGLGKRLRPLTLELPKPMVPIVNRPIMEHIVELLRGLGMTELVSNLSYKPDAIREHFGDGSKFGVELNYEYEENLLGTAGGVRNVADFLTAGGDFFVIAGDALTDVDLAPMRAFHDSHDGVATLAVKRVADTSQYGVVIHDSEGRIQGFQEKPPADEALSELANCMIYMFRPEIFDYFPEVDEVDFAFDVFPALLENDVPFYVHETTGYWNDVGNLSEFLRGNFHALDGRVAVNAIGELRDVPEGGTMLVGEGCEIADDAWLHGPLVLGGGTTVGAGAMLRETVTLAGTTIPAGSVIGRGMAARG